MSLDTLVWYVILCEDLVCICVMCSSFAADHIGTHVLFAIICHQHGYATWKLTISCYDCYIDLPVTIFSRVTEVC